MAEDWRETGRAVRDRTTEIAKETAKAGRDALKATVSSPSADANSDPAKRVPPESVNEYDATSSMGDIKETVKRAGQKAMEKVKQVYERVEGMPNRQENTEDMPSDSPASPLSHTGPREKTGITGDVGRGYGDEAEQEAGIKDEHTKKAFEKGKQLEANRESINGM